MNYEIACLFFGGALMLIPVFNHTVREINKPSEITHIRVYDEQDNLIRESVNLDGNIIIKKTGNYRSGDLWQITDLECKNK